MSTTSLLLKNVTNNSEIEDIVKTVTKTGTKPIDDGSAAAQIDIILAFKVDLPSIGSLIWGWDTLIRNPTPYFFPQGLLQEGGTFSDFKNVNLGGF